MIQPVCQPIMRRATQECPARTSLDLELDLQASRTRQNRLNDELQALRDLKQKLEEMKGRGETDLPLCVLEDERFQKLLKQAEKQVWAAYRFRVKKNILLLSLFTSLLKDSYRISHLTTYTMKFRYVNTISLLVSTKVFKPRIWNVIFLMPPEHLNIAFPTIHIQSFLGIFCPSAFADLQSSHNW